MKSFPLTRLLRICALLIATTLVTHGCSRTKYRLDADREAYDLIEERNVDPRWSGKGYSIEIDPRSRYFDPENPDCPPMPLDDPLSQQYMRSVDGKQGWSHWLENGVRAALENPTWQDSLSEYVNMNEEGAVQLDLESALTLAYVHSPSHQSQLETLFLSALDVSAERFRLDTRFFGGYDAAFSHQGPLFPPSLSFDSASNRWVINPAAEGVESNRLTIGRPSAGNPAIQAQRRFATAGELLVGFANSFVFEFSGGDANLTSSLANFTFLQPLLRGAGRDIALEQLTFNERTLLANMRAYGQFRQGFYTQVAIGEVGVSGPQRGGSSTSINVFAAFGGVGGYTGLLQQLQQIRNSEDNLSLQLRYLKQLEALLSVGVIDLVQVDQFRQSVESERANLLQQRNNLERAIDQYMTTTLGLPPDLPIELDDSLIRQFQLVPREATAVQDAIINLQDRLGVLPQEPTFEAITPLLNDAFKLIDPVYQQLEGAKNDMTQMDVVLPERLPTMTEEEVKTLQEDREQLNSTLNDLLRKFTEISAELKNIEDGFNENTRRATTEKIIVWCSDILQLAQRAVLVQARARLESVRVDRIDLDPREALQIALQRRLDFMNGRAALVDSWRLIQVRADALQSVLNVSASGDIRTVENNPLSFRGSTGSMQLGLEFDAPLTRLLERNNYREALVNFQRSRRALIQSGDRLHLGLRALLRQIERLRMNLEIQRRAVAIAIRRVDLTRAQLYKPVPPPLPGQRAAQFGPTAAFNLLSALSSLRNTQNSFLGVWLEYYAARMRLARELGTMTLDEDGRWIEMPLSQEQQERLRQELQMQGPQPRGALEFLPPIPSDAQQAELSHPLRSR